MLILHIETGYGSRKLAEFISSRAVYHGVEHDVYTLHDLIPRFMDDILFESYRAWCFNGAKHQSRLYSSKYSYRIIYGLLSLVIRFKKKYFKKIRAIFEDHDVVIATSFYAAFFARQFKKLFGLNYKIHGVLGDYGISSAWRLDIDSVITSHSYSNRTLDELRNIGVRIFPWGLPVPPQKTVSFTPAYRDKTVLVCGGGWGLGSVYDAIPDILRISSVKKVIVVSGDNGPLYRSLKEKYKDAVRDNRVDIYRTVDDMEVLYRQSSVILTKAGGLSLTEAAYFGIPIIVTSALPGHEETNLRVFEERQGCLLAMNNTEIISHIVRIFTSEEFARKLTQNARTLINSNSTEMILQAMMNMPVETIQEESAELVITDDERIASDFV